MKNVNVQTTIKLLAANDPQASVYSGPGGKKTPKSYRLVEMTQPNGRRFELIIESVMLLNLKYVKEFFIDHGHEITNEEIYWRRIQAELSAPTVNKLILSNRPGYVGQSYLCANGDIIGNLGTYVRLHPNAAFSPPPESSKGTLKQWRVHVASHAAYSDRMMLALGVGFSGLIAKWTNQENGGVHFHGDSSDGKTTALYMAISIYGPHQCVCSWSQTDAALEEIAMGRNDAFLPINELKLLDSNPIIAAQRACKITYTLAEGRGKQRSKVYQDTINTWTTAILSTGELSLAEHASGGDSERLNGERVRVVDLSSDSGSGYRIFDKLPPKFDNGSDFSDHIIKNSKKYYGTARKPFVEGLLEWEHDEAGSVERIIQGYISNFLRKCEVDSTDGQEMRIAKRFAVAYAAAAIASDLGILGFKRAQIGKAIRKCYSDYVNSRPLSHAQLVDEARQALVNLAGHQHLLDITNRKVRYSPNKVAAAPGFITNVNGEEVYAVKSDWLSTITKSKLVKKSLVEELNADGILMKGSKTIETRQISLGGQRAGKVRCYCFRTSLLK